MKTVPQFGRISRASNVAYFFIASGQTFKHNSNVSLGKFGMG